MVNINNPRIMIDVSLPKPSKAVFAGTTPVRMSANITPSAVTSAGIVSIENNISAIRIMTVSKIIERVMYFP